ncbi:MAG TPA: ABC transporter permease [Candidatus Acidoferrales bacterium]|nr:ABC transporter permease [Candidatus Acidoferrales bacterium]
MKTAWQDLAYAFRILRKSPMFSIIAVLTLALGIGANTAIFSYVDAWMIKPLPYPQAERLMVFQEHNTKKGWTDDTVTSTADFLDFQKQATSFEQTAGYAGWNFNLTGNGAPALVDGGRVSGNFFATLGAKPLMGRTFLPSDDVAGAPRVAILSEGLWRSRYGQDPKIIGRSIDINAEAYTVVGVMPGKFLFPLIGISNIWTPFAFTPEERADRNSSWFQAFGRLKPGATEEQAAAETDAVFAGLQKEYPKTDTDITMLVTSMTKAIGDNEGVPQVKICFWLVGLILLIACANVANLMLARATQRTKEMAVRGALGATRRRLIRQLLTESLLLFFVGGVAGTLFGMWGMAWIESQIPGSVRGYLVNYGQVNMDTTTLLFTLGIALLCGVIFGLAPAFQSSSVDLNQALKEASGKASGGGRSARLRKVFVAGEIALAVVVLISTTLLVKSFIIAATASPGFNASNLMTAQLAVPKTKYNSDAMLRNFNEAALSRIRALPGVTAAGAASALSFGAFGQSYEVEAVGKPAPRPGEELGAHWTAVSPEYFSAMQIPLLKGRVFTSADIPGSGNVAMIDESLAGKFWPSEDPVGQKLTYGPNHIVCTIVGVVKNVKLYQLREVPPRREMYVPFAQAPTLTMGFVARTAGTITGIGDAIRNSIWAMDADQPVSSVEEMSTLMRVQDAGNLILTKLMVAFGVLALFLCGIGIYGVMAHMVAQRTHEIGIRIALGAAPGNVMLLVISQGLKLAIIGIVIGVAGAFGVTGLLADNLYQVTTRDPATFVSVAVGFALVAIAACYVPARRAMKVSPIVALRYE